MGKRRRRTSSSGTSSSSSTSTSSSCSSTLECSDAQHLFGIMVAALSNRELQKPTSEGNLVIQKSLDHILLSLLSKSPNSILRYQQTLDIRLISLLPALLNSKCTEIACSSLEIVGAASLFSFEMNEQIAYDDEIMKGLISAVVSSNRSVSMAACNALLDLFTTSAGRSKLLECSAFDNLIYCFLQVPKSSTPSISLVMERVDNKTIFKIGFMEDEYPILLLHVTIILINDCTFEQLKIIPKQLLRNLSTHLAILWAQVHKHHVTNTVHELDKLLFYLSNITTNNVAQALFRLSMEGNSPSQSNFQEVKNSIFELGQISYESFIINHWEKSPLLIKRLSLHENVFTSFSQLLKSKGTAVSFLGFLFQNLVSALPINSDELDIMNFLKESRDNLGCPLIYQQDIRVVKTLDSRKEIHFFNGSHYLNTSDTLKIEEAYKDGYTFALRGMEFHFEDIAAISEGLTFLFGQSSTGVNMYLTPPNSQGLARHRDDHCVLVYQIRGVKRWKIFPNLCSRLPRLYDDLESENGSENDIIVGCKEFLLKEGDILYIPRGFPHEASTVFDDGEINGNEEYSLHLTLAIEIEPPFEWEGFIHVAIHHWSQNHKLFEYSSHNLHNVAIHLMHIAVNLIGDVDHTFRKASLIGSTEDFLQTHQKSTFNSLIKKLDSESNFSEIASNIETALSKNEDIFEKLRWVRQEDSSVEIMEVFHLLVNEKDKVEGAFMEVKSRFCSDVVFQFDDVICRYIVLLEKYRSTRKHYINGMLALNCV